MSKKIIIDMSLVEEALKLSSHEREVVVERERAKNRARLIKYGAAGCALVILSIGAAFWLGTQWRSHRSAPGNIVASLLQPPHKPRLESSPNKVVTNVNLFNTIGRDGLVPLFFNPYFVGLSAGHLYSSSNAESWEKAWCYADFDKDLMKIKVDLEVRTQSTSIAVPVTQRELRELALSEADVVFLRSRCPWKR